ncbi:MAG: hypothetical protein A2Z72_07555 [Omnitrophica bacterium RBG_13_46_9]|nr:MAG: hypothetical protein A2Z72_07555 [Omnitrophica bacterium RBG_13_46_9]
MVKIIKSYIILPLAILAVSFLVNTGFSVNLYAEINEKEGEILCLIEEGVINYENQKYLFALQKYQEAMAIAGNALIETPDNRRILALKELLENKIRQCRSKIDKIEEGIDTRFTYKRELEKVYVLIEEADRDRAGDRFYIALKKYNDAKEKIKLVLKNIPDWQEAKLLMDLTDRKIASCRERIDSLDMQAGSERVFSGKIEEIMGMIERASQDEEAGRYLIALGGYSRSLKMLGELEKEHPEKMRIRLVKEIAEIKISECRKKIDRIEKEIESGIAPEPPKSVSEKPRPAEEAVEEKEEPVSRIREAEEARPYEEPVQKKEIPAEEKLPIKKKIVAEEPKPKPAVERKEIKIPPVHSYIAGYAKTLAGKIGAFIAESRESGRENMEKAKLADSERNTGLKERVEDILAGLKKRLKERKETIIKEREIRKARPVETAGLPVEEKEEPVSRIRAAEEAGPYEAPVAKKEVPAEEKAPLEKKPVAEEPKPKPAVERKELKIPPVHSYIAGYAKTLAGKIGAFIAESRKTGKGGMEKADLADGKRKADTKKRLENILSTLKTKFKNMRSKAAQRFERPTEVAEKKPLEKEHAAAKGVAEEPEAGPPVSQPEEEPEEIAPAKKPRMTLPIVLSLDDYRVADDIKIIIDGQQVDGVKALVRNDDIWVNVKELAGALGTTLIYEKKNKFIILRTDGMPLGFRIGDGVIMFRDTPFYALDRPVLLFADEPYAGFDALGILFNISVDWRPSEKCLIFESIYKKEEAFTVFTKPKPQELIDKEKAAMPPPVPEVEHFEMKRLIPYVPKELKPDMNMRVMNSMNYLYNNDPLNKKRVRTEYITMSGKVYDYTFDSHFQWRDEVTGSLVNKEKFIGIYGNGMWLKMLGLYKDLAPLRSQSEGYEGFEFTKFYSPFVARMWGGWKEINVTATSGDVGSVKYFGRIGGVGQRYKSDLLDLRGEVMGVVNEAETTLKRGKTDFPRRNVVYFADGTFHLPADFSLSGQYAGCNYNPDNLKEELIQDKNWRLEGVWDRAKKDNFYLKSEYEFVGTDYASIGIPSNYQDYKGWSVYGRYAPSKIVQLSARYQESQDNVDDVDSQPTRDDKYFSSNISYNFPTNTGLNFGWTRSYVETTGPGQEYIELQASLSDSYRATVSQNFGSLSLYFSYDRYHVNAIGSDTDNWSDTYSASLYKFLPTHRGSFIRLRHELKKMWYMASGNFTTITNDTDLSWRYYFTRDLYVYNTWILRQTETGATADTAYISAKTGAFWKLDNNLAVGTDFTFDQRELNNPSRKDWNEWQILFRCNWGFDYNSPYKWAKIKGYVFRDLNANGVFDSGDEGIKDALIIIPDEIMAQTDKKGHYYMNEIIPGSKTVKLDVKTLPMELAVLYDNVVEVDIKKSQTEEVNFPLVVLGSLRGRVFVDENENDIYDIGEEGLEDVDVVLGPEGRWTRTDENGKFSFDFVKPGAFELMINPSKIPIRYKLISDRKKEGILNQGEDIEDLSFIVRLRPVVKKVF